MTKSSASAVKPSPGFEDALRLRAGLLGIKEFCGSVGNWRGSSRTQSTGESSRRLNLCKVVARGHFTTNHSNSDKVPGATAYHLSGENKSGQHAMIAQQRAILARL